MELSVQPRDLSLPAEVTISTKTATAAWLTQGLPTLSPWGDGSPPSLPSVMGLHGQVSPDLAGSAQLDPNCLLMTVSLALPFKTKLRAFLFQMCREQAV